MEFAERELLADPALASTNNRYGRTLLHDAAARGNLRMVELFLRLGADANERSPDGRTPLYSLANERLTDGANIVHVLVRAGAQVNAQCGTKKCTALHMAARRGNTEIAQALIECGADLNVRDSTGDTPLQRAKNCRKPDVAQLLALRGAAAGAGRRR